MTLQDICELIVDCPHVTDNDEGTGYPLIRTPNVGKGILLLEGVHRVSKDVYERRNRRAKPQPDDLILAREAPAGNVALIREGQDVCLGQRTVLIRPNQNFVVPEFLTFYLLAPYTQHRIKQSANGSTVEHVNMPNIRGLEIELPPLVVQKEIASILSTYDTLIAINTKRIKLLEESARELYKEWFVRMRFPGYEQTKFVKGIPEGWTYKKVTDLLDIRYGKDHKMLEDGDYPCYGSGGVMRRVNKYLHEGESVLIPRKGSLNNIMIANGVFWTIDTMFYTIPKMRNVAKYAYYMLSSIDMESLNAGAALPSMTTNILSNMDILLPSQNVLEKFESYLSPMFSGIDALTKENQTLAAIRDRLLPRLLSGELKVKA
jgi:type I restriction enzyme S subunit